MAAASVAAAAAAPPLFPNSPTAASPALLPTPTSPSLVPSIHRFAPSPAPWIRRAAAAPAGRASASESWVRDKVARAGLAPPMESSTGSKVSGRASLSTSWVRDKLVGTKPSYTPPPATRSCAKRILTPSSSPDWNGKKQRYDSPAPTPASDSEDSGSDSELEYYAGPAFLNAAPHPSAIPKPRLHMLRHPKLPTLSCY
jgi:hypothetical protein